MPCARLPKWLGSTSQEADAAPGSPRYEHCFLDANYVKGSWQKKRGFSLAGRTPRAAKRRRRLARPAIGDFLLPSACIRCRGLKRPEATPIAESNQTPSRAARIVRDTSTASDSVAGPSGETSAIAAPVACVAAWSRGGPTRPGGGPCQRTAMPLIIASGGHILERSPCRTAMKCAIVDLGHRGAQTPAKGSPTQPMSLGPTQPKNR
jgi:hypothetical protein